MSIRQEKFGAIISYVTIAFYVLAGLLYTPFLIKSLGMSDYGLFSLSASIVAYFSLDFGIGAAQTRLIAKYIFEGREDKIKGLLGITSKLYLLVDVFLFLVLGTTYIFSEQIFVQLTPIELERFKTIFLISSFFVIFNFPLLPVNGIFIGYKKIIALKLFDLVGRVLSVALLVTALLLDYGLYGVVIVNAFATLLIQLSKFYFLTKKVNLRINIRYRDKEILKTIGSFSLWATIAAIADKFFFAIIPTLLAIFADTTQIALFAVVISIEGYVFTISKALNGIFLPKVMAHVSINSGNVPQTNLMIKVGRIQLYIVGVIIVGLVAFGKEFFSHWLGEGFNVSYYALILVMLPCLFHLTQTIAEELIYARNKIKYRAFANIIGSVICLITIVLLAPKLGAVGAAIGVCLSFVIGHNVFIDVVYNKVLGLDMGRFFYNCQLKILPILAISGIIGFLFQRYIPTESLTMFVLKMAVWVVVTFVLLWFLAFNGEEKNIVTQTIKLK